MQKIKHYQTIIIGGGINGCALFYELAKYTDIKSIALFEKYGEVASLNSSGPGNSQTIHCGDIETNYTVEKAEAVSKKAKMIGKYCDQYGYKDTFIQAFQKLALGIGDEEVAFIRSHYEKIKHIFPYLKLYEKDEIAKIEPRVVLLEDGSQRPEPMVAMGTQEADYNTCDFQALSQTLVENAQKQRKMEKDGWDRDIDLYLGRKVDRIEKDGAKNIVHMDDGGKFSCDFVVVSAGAHSLYFAHKMGIGKRYSTLPIAGGYYKTKQKMLNGKVYMVQNPKLPYAALHGDPDILLDGNTRFGPTSSPYIFLEQYNRLNTFVDFLKCANPRLGTIRALLKMLFDSDVRNYLLKNIALEIPFIHKGLFVKEARKIVPTLKESEIEYAEGFGGVRPQIVDSENKSLLLGEASINTERGMIFNMTPSPGATSALANAKIDLDRIAGELNLTVDQKAFDKDLVD